MSLTSRKKKIYEFRVSTTQEQRLALEHLAERENVELAEVVRRLIRDGLEADERRIAEARRKRLAAGGTAVT